MGWVKVGKQQKKKHRRSKEAMVGRWSKILRDEM